MAAMNADLIAEHPLFEKKLVQCHIDLWSTGSPIWIHPDAVIFPKVGAVVMAQMPTLPALPKAQPTANGNTKP